MAGIFSSKQNKTQSVRHRVAGMVLLSVAASALAITAVYLPPGNRSRAESQLPVGTVTLKADYQFQNTLGSSVGVAPSLTDIGSGSNTYAVETVDATTRTVRQFPQANGFSLAPTTGVIPNDSYTIVALFRFQSTSSYRRIIDLANGNEDTGLYSDNGFLHFYDQDIGSNVSILPDTYVQVVLTRGPGNTVTGYVDGQQQFSFSDVGGLGVITASNVLRLFKDNDPPNGGEESAGAIARLRLYDGPLDAAQVAALERLPGGGTPTPTSTPTPTPSPSPGSAFVVTTTADSGVGSLRQAIIDANNSPGADTITFNIPGSGLRTIAPLAPLPVVTGPVDINGYSQPGAVANTDPTGPLDPLLLVELNGQSAGSGSGLSISGGGSTIRGLIINRFPDVGIRIQSIGGNTISGNFIGTDQAGNSALPNGGAGVFIDGISNNTVGGVSPASRNLLSGNNFHGVEIVGAGATGNQVKGNMIGPNASGNAPLSPGSVTGVFLHDGAGGAVIGGTTAAERNIISGNGNFGIWFDGSSNNIVKGNYIGINVSGTAAVPNSLRAITVGNGAANNIFGGPEAGARNVVSGNLASAFRFFDPGTTGNIVQGNYIGTAADGVTPIGNAGSAIDFRSSPASGNTIGGAGANEGNLIAFNTGNGILMSAGTSNAILGNLIHSNTMLGIDLAGDAVSPNDLNDIDAGPNNIQNYPVLTSANSNGGTTTIIGTLNSLANTTFRIEFFSSTACDGSGNGEGQMFLGFANVNTAGNAGTINAVLPVIVPAGSFITSTATDPQNNTSEFSDCVLSTASGTPTPTNTPTATPTATPTPGGIESDVAPRPNGNGTVVATDVIQMRRFSTGLDTPEAGSEFQRADGAPRGTLGDGIVNAGDVIQARRYSTGLDPLTAQGGPSGPPGVTENIISGLFDDIYGYFFGRELQVGEAIFQNGKTMTVPVEITPFGDEVAASFTLEYDPTVLSDPKVTLGEGAPKGSVLTVNINEEGRIGILIDSTEALTASAMPVRIAMVTFSLIGTDRGETRLLLTDGLAVKGLSDAEGNTLAMRFNGRAIVVPARGK